MDPQTLGQYLDELRARKTYRARVKLPDGSGFDVAMVPDAPPAADGALVDETGRPVDLDEGMPPLARDDIAEANFPKEKR